MGCRAVYEAWRLLRTGRQYRDLLPLINSGACDLLDSDKMKAQLVSLERRIARGGKDSIDHPPGGHDDIANAAAGVLVACLLSPGVRGFDRPLPEISARDMGLL